MKDELKIDLNEKSLYDFICNTISGIGVFMVILLCLGVLVAPAFSCFFKSWLYEKYDPRRYYDRMAMVKRKMLIINLILWLVAIAAWILLFCCGVGYIKPLN